MNLITCDDWTEVEFSEREQYIYAQTSDPRVLAVIQRDTEGVNVGELYDGDAINPIIRVESHYGLTFRWTAGYDGGEAQTIQDAYDRWGWGDETARRYLWIFHGIAAEDVNGGYDRDGHWIVVTSNSYLKHIGAATRPASYEEAREDCKSIAQDLTWALDGYVYGIGYATLESRRLHDDEPIQLEEWDINVDVWGHVGTAYAKQTAAAFSYESPTLPELLELVTA